jgi:hypothetical protein
LVYTRNAITMKFNTLMQDSINSIYGIFCMLSMKSLLKPKPSSL